MPADTLHTRWNISSGPGLSVGAGVFSGQVAVYTLTGDRRERFDYSLVAVGVGGAVGVNLHDALELVMSGANAVASTQSSPVETSAATPILFPGRSRSARDFEGGGTIFDFSAGLGLGAGLQVILFGILLNHMELLRVGRIAYDVARGSRHLGDLRREAPAVTLVASAFNLVAGASATAFTGLFSLYTPGQRSVPTPGGGSSQHYAY